MKKLKLIVSTFLILCAIAVSGQSGKVTKAQRKVEDKKKEQLKKQEKAEIKAQKHHKSIQTAKVRKRMRKHRRGDIHVSSYDQRPGFFKRLFHKRKH